MTELQQKMPHISLDEKWFPCQPAGEFGFLGDRIICELGASDGSTTKKLLLRRVEWLQRNSSKENATNLEIEQLPEGSGLHLRPLAVKAYQWALPSNDRKLKRRERQFLQQDITGLITLRNAVLKAVNDGSPGKVWQLFYSGCKTLNNYGKSIGSERLVPLQCPDGLAVDIKTNQIVVLDGEIKIPALSDGNEAAYAKWFAARGTAKSAIEAEASLLHSKALLLYFREILGLLGNRQSPAGAKIANQLGAQFEQLKDAGTIEEMQEKAGEFAEDWSVSVEDADAIPAEATQARPVVQRQRGRSWLGWFVGSSLLNVLLVLLVIGLAVLLLSGLAAGKKLDVEDSSLQFSSYCVIFPVQGTSSEKVLNSVTQLYPDRVLAPKNGESEQSKLLNERLNSAVKSLKEPDELRKLFVALNSKHAIRFNGYSPDAADSGLASIVANGALYRINSAGEKSQYGSLLRANSVEKLLMIAGLDKQAAPRSLLDSLKAATHEYASFKDALTVIGDRTAFILKVEPSAKAHEAVRAQLLNRDATPVFVPRPVFELFDAVDPAAGSGGGIARYSLKLDTRCDWRLVGADDRKKTDFQANETNDKMKWLSFGANQEIVWTTLPVLRQTGRTDNVSSFDIAIKVNANKVVVFRNQSILAGESRDQVLKQARVYLDKGLALTKVAIEEGMTVRQQEERFTGALLYSFLAEQATEPRDDMEIMTPVEFEQKKQREDKVLVK